MSKPVIYLASPYGSGLPTNHGPNETEKLMEERYQQVVRAATRLIDAGNLVFCPIAHSHDIARRLENPSFEFWREFDFWALEHCDIFAILMLRGWDTSDGVEQEWGRAEALGKPILFIPSSLSEHSPIRR